MSGAETASPAQAVKPTQSAVDAQFPSPSSEHPSSSPKSTNDLIREVAPGQLKIGEVRLNQARGIITFPAKVNLLEGPIEYLLVAESGKIHESVLRTTAAPYHVQLALLLLGIQPTDTNAPASTVSKPKPSTNELLTVEVSWKVGRRVRSAPAGNYILNRKTGKPIGAIRWAFIGSRIREDGFGAQIDGSIITVIDDPDAIIATQLPESDDDDNWLAFGRKLPPLDSDVEVTISVRRPPAKSKAEKKTPKTKTP